MNKLRITLMVIAITASVICLGFMGFKAYVTKIYDSRSCKWANIDNIELRAKIDIPATTECLCEYNENSETKQAIFTLDKKSIDGDYIRKNKLRKIVVPEKILGTDFPLEKNPKLFAQNDNLYVRDGKSTNEIYHLLYDAKAGKIWVNVKYLD